MTTLETALMDAGFAGLTDAESLAYGNSTVVVGGDDELWSYRGVADRFGAYAAEAIATVMQQSGLTVAVMSYAGRGIQLSNAQTQGQLSAMAASPAVRAITVSEGVTLDDVCNVLKEIGVTHGTRWQLLGCAQPTIEQITAARANNAFDQWAAQVLNDVIPAARSAGKTIAETKTLISES